MVEKPDAGDIVDLETVKIDFTDTAHDVFGKVTDAAAAVVRRAWPRLRDGVASRTPMDLKAGSYFGGRKPADGHIDWEQSAVQIYNLIRGVTHPYPGAFTFLDGTKITVWSAWPVDGSGTPGSIQSQSPLRIATGKGLLEIKSLQLESEPEMTAEDFISRCNTCTAFDNSR